MAAPPGMAVVHEPRAGSRELVARAHPRRAAHPSDWHESVRMVHPCRHA